MKRERMAEAALTFGVVTPVAYLAQRVVERWLNGVVDPLVVLRQAHTAFYWRCSTSAWWGALAVILVLGGARAPRFRRSWSALWVAGLVLVAWRLP